MKKRLQVFISSTYIDLKEERQAAVSAILKSGHIPAGMELFTAGDKSQLETIKRWIDESDVYMLILGGRYGSVEADSGVSYTELEFNYAVETEKPLFSVVITEKALEEKVKIHGTSVIEKERQTELNMFRSLVLSNMSSFFEDLKDIRLAVMESLPEIAATRNLSGWISGNELPDTKGLIDEITRLNSEISELSKQNAVLNKRLLSTKPSANEEAFEELIQLLQKTVIKIPKSLTKDKSGGENDLFHIFKTVKDNLIKGVTNGTGQNEYYYFLYDNVCPKLQIHDLVQNEKVPSVRYRRFAITKKGQELLAYIERKNLSDPTI